MASEAAISQGLLARSAVMAVAPHDTLSGGEDYEFAIIGR